MFEETGMAAGWGYEESTMQDDEPTGAHILLEWEQGYIQQWHSQAL